MGSADDELTLKRLRLGDAAEFERVFRSTYAPLCRFLARYVDPPAAEEIAQETFLRLWGDRHALQIHTSLRAYLFASARNHALNQLKRTDVHERWSEAEAAALESAHVEPDAPQALERAEVGARVRTVVDRLPPRLRETVDLRWGRGWSQ